MMLDKELKESINIILLSTVIMIIGQLSYAYARYAIISALIVTALITILIKHDYIIPFLLLLLPMNRVLTFGPISAPTIIIVIAILRKGKSLMNLPKNIFFLIVCLFLYSLLLFFGDEYIFFDAIKVILMLAFWYIYTNSNSSYTHYNKFIIFGAIGCILSTMIVFVISPSNIVEGSRFTFSKNGENVLGILCAVISINLLVILIKNSNKHNLKYLFLMVALLIIGFLTQSRSFLAGIAIGIFGLITIMICKFKFKNLLRIILIIFLIIFFGYVLLQFSDTMSNYFDSIIYRINKLKNTDISNGRFELWKQYFILFEEFPKYFWFGGYRVGTHGIDLVAHNMIIEQVATYGVIGSLIVILLFKTTIKCTLKGNGYRINLFSYGIIPLISFLGVSMVSHTILGVPQTTMFFLCLFAMFEKCKYTNLNGGIK